MDPILLAHCAPDSTMPAPWQVGWAPTQTAQFPSLPHRAVARAPAGTPLPAGVTAYSPPEITDAIRATAKADLQRQLDQLDEAQNRVARGLIDSLLADPDALDRSIAHWLGQAHSFASQAPLAIVSLDEACARHTTAFLEWCSRCSTVVIRTAPAGFSVAIGIGSYLRHISVVGSYEEAERVGINAVHAERAETMRRVRYILAGWSPDTGYHSATITTAQNALPIYIRRGPMTASELPRAGGLSSSSRDLPVVAAVENGAVIQRWPDRVTWDDDASRAAQREREVAGQRKRDAEVRQALDEFRSHPVLRERVLDDHLERGAITLDNGHDAEILGPARMRQDGACALALVRFRGWKGWMALGQFVSA